MLDTSFSAIIDVVDGDNCDDATTLAPLPAMAADFPVESAGLSNWREAAVRGAQIRRTRLASNEQETHAVGRLRYEYFIARDKKTSRFANHHARRYLEPVDALSLNFFVPHGDGLLAAVRLTRALDAVTDNALLQVVNHCGLSALDLSVTMIISRLVVRNETRAHLSLPGMFRDACRVGRATGARYCIMASKPTLIALYRRVGFIPNGQGFVSAEAGEMRVAIYDDKRNRDELDGINPRFYDTWTDKVTIEEAAPRKIT